MEAFKRRRYQTEDQAKEAVQAQGAGDMAWLKSIKGCFGAKADLKVQVIETKLNGLVKARVWTPDGDGSLVLWMPRENVRN